MKVNYKEGDIFAIPLKGGFFSICQIIWAPKGDYKKVLSFCVLGNHEKNLACEVDNKKTIPLNDNGRIINMIFTGTKKIVNGEWPVIGFRKLSEVSVKLKYFNIAGSLHKGDEFIRKLTPEEYNQYPSMSVLGFELVQEILINN